MTKRKHGKQYEKTTVALPLDMVEKIMEITKVKFPYRKIHYYVEGVREAMNDYINIHNKEKKDNHEDMNRDELEF